MSGETYIDDNIDCKPRPGDSFSTDANIGPEEGFLLSQADGQLSIQEIVQILPFDKAKVGEMLIDLRRRGILDWDGGTAPPESAPVVEDSPEEHIDEPTSESEENVDDLLDDMENLLDDDFDEGDFDDLPLEESLDEAEPEAQAKANESPFDEEQDQNDDVDVDFGFEATDEIEHILDDIDDAISDDTEHQEDLDSLDAMIDDIQDSEITETIEPQSEPEPEDIEEPLNDTPEIDDLESDEDLDAMIEAAESQWQNRLESVEDNLEEDEPEDIETEESLPDDMEDLLDDDFDDLPSEPELEPEVEAEPELEGENEPVQNDDLDDSDHSILEELEALDDDFESVIADLEQTDHPEPSSTPDTNDVDTELKPEDTVTGQVLDMSDVLNELDDPDDDLEEISDGAANELDMSDLIEDTDEADELDTLDPDELKHIDDPEDDVIENDIIDENLEEEPEPADPVAELDPEPTPEPEPDVSSDDTDPEEDVQILQLRKRLNVQQRILQKDDPFEALGVKGGSSDKQIRDAWHRLSKIFHPDRYYDLDLPDDLQTELNDLYGCLQQAYELIGTREARRSFMFNRRDNRLSGSRAKESENESREQTADEKAGGTTANADRLAELAEEALTKGQYKSAITNFKLAGQMEKKSYYEERAKLVSLLEKVHERIEGLLDSEDLPDGSETASLVETIKKIESVLPNTAVLLKGIVEFLFENTEETTLIRTLTERLLKLNRLPDTLILGATVYLRCKMPETALDLLADAKERDPGNTSIKSLIKQAKRSMK